ncbi:hypothetical protein Tco_1052411, partial [Tanacetum coccineum]
CYILLPTEFPSARKLKDSANCHFVVIPVTPPSWKQHLRDISLEKLYDIHDRAYMEVEKDKAYAELERKCNEALQDLDKNPLEIDKLRQDRVAVASMFHGRCIAVEEVVAWKEPFTLEKMHCYRSSSQKEFDQAGDDLATASYPFISKASSDSYASLEELLSKKPRSH